MRQPVKRYSKVFLNLSLAFVVLLLCIFVVPKVLLFFLPFIIGWVIAAIANRPVHFFEEKFRIKRKASSAFVIITVIAIVVLAGYMLITRLASATIGFITVLPELWENLEQDFMEIGQNLNVIYDGLPADVKQNIVKIGQEMDGYIAELVSSFGTPTVYAVRDFAKNIPSMLINVIMCILSAYFFIAEKEAIGLFCQRYIPKTDTSSYSIL